MLTAAISNGNCKPTILGELEDVWQLWLTDLLAREAVQREGTVWLEPGLSKGWNPHTDPAIIRMIMADTRLGSAAILAPALKQLSQ